MAFKFPRYGDWVMGQSRFQSALRTGSEPLQPEFLTQVAEKLKAYGKTLRLLDAPSKSKEERKKREDNKHTNWIAYKDAYTKLFESKQTLDKAKNDDPWNYVLSAPLARDLYMKGFKDKIKRADKKINSFFSVFHHWHTTYVPDEIYCNCLIK